MTAADHPVPRSTTGPLVSARGIRRRYGRREVLRGVDLDLEAGELVALLGPNGSGKTTLMAALVGAATHDEGTITHAPVAGGRVEQPGWVPQGGGTWGRLTVRENLELFASLLRLPGDRAAIARTAAADAELEPWIDHGCWQLSGGLRQRLNIAIGLLGSPSVLVLDEPTTGVDLVHRASMWRVLRDRADAGAAVLFSTHNQDDAARADRVVVMVDGSIAWDGPLAGIAERGGAADPTVDQREAVTRGLLAIWDEPTRGAH